MAAAAVASHAPPTIPPVPRVSPDALKMGQQDPGRKPVPKSMTNGKGPAAPRGRRERPCDACRKRKSKCVVTEASKVCAACSLHGQECTYIEDPQPRKRRLDSSTGKDAAEFAKRSRTVVASSIHDPAAGPDVRSEAEREPQATKNNIASVPTAREIPRKASQHFSTHIGPTTELEPILLDLSSMIGNSQLGDAYQKPDNGTAFLVDPLGAERFKAANQTALANVERLVGSHGFALLRLYLYTTHSSFPVVEEEFFADYEAGRKHTLDPALLATIYSLSAPWLVRDPTHHPISPLPDAAQLEDLAFTLFGDSLLNPTLSTVQAGILLMQSPTVDSKTLNTQLVGAAHELGLHLDCTSWTLTPGERGLRKRLAWALYMQDKWTSLIHGRPSAIARTNWAVQELVDDDFDRYAGTLNPSSSAAEVERGRALFKQMIGLTDILSTVLDTFYTLQAMKEIEDAVPNGTRLILERAKPVQLKLKQWFAGLPAHLKMDAASTGKPSSTGYLHLAYFATEITLHRCIVRSLETSHGDPYLSHICRSAAKTRLISAMDFVNRLRTEHLNAFWYFPSKVNFALIGTFGSLLLATAPCHEEVEFYRTRLSEYRWTLSVSSKTADFLAFAVDSLDQSSGLLKNLPRRPSTSEFTAKMAAVRPPPPAMQGISPPQDDLMADAPTIHLGPLPLPMLETNVGSTMASGLVSPSTSTSSGSTTYEAYVESFPSHLMSVPAESYSPAVQMAASTWS